MTSTVLIAIKIKLFVIPALETQIKRWSPKNIVAEVLHAITIEAHHAFELNYYSLVVCLDCISPYQILH